MSVRTIYSCDWCQVDSRPVLDDEGAPNDWRELGPELLCPSCVRTRADAIDAARVAAREAAVLSRVLP